MDALNEAKRLVQDAYYDERGMADVMRQDAAIWATIAQAEQLKRIADALEQPKASQTERWAVIDGVNQRIG